MIQLLFYGSIFVISLLFAATYIFMWHKHFDVNFTLIFPLVPVACLGYLMTAAATSLDGAVRATQIVYIGGCFLQLFILLSIMNLCGISIKRWIRSALFAVCALLYLSVLTTGVINLFYKSVSFEIVGGVPTLTKEYGILHQVFYGMVFVYFLAGLVVLIYSYLKKKKQIPRTILYLLVVPDVVCVLSFFVGRRLIPFADPVPLGYVLAEFVYLLIAYRFNLYNVSDTVIDSFVQEERVGYISFDFKYRYLGSNEVARMLIPELKELAIDENFGYKPNFRTIRHYLDSFKEDPENHVFTYTFHPGSEEEDLIYNVNVSYLYDGPRKRGYMITYTDDTADRKYIELLDGYNEKLKEEVEEKTRHIVAMHDNLILGLATMVESRDNSTGGHIRRTSEGVRILVDQIRAEGKLRLSEDFCRNMIKAAPMHDLGKIAVDDAVLRKPGRFTEDEFREMQRHAAEGARVIHEILKQTDDEAFKVMAENVAHFHHERFDGSGYPNGLAGEQIPLEARIMAVADVYDALVSKRVYKEAYSFEKADRIIMEGMGTQFDPKLKTAYEAARPFLEAYYKDLEVSA